MDERRDAVVPGRRDFRLQPLLLDTARVLMLLGVATIFSGSENRAASAMQQAFVGLLLWLLGVSRVSPRPRASGSRTVPASRSGHRRRHGHRRPKAPPCSVQLAPP